MQEPLGCRLVIIVSVPCEQGPLGSSLLIIVYNNYHVHRGHLVVG